MTEARRDDRMARIPIMRRYLVPIALLIAASCGGSAQRPNVVLIIGDDHGYPYFGFMGSEVVQTPHLDRLAREGTVFTRAFTTASYCRPSLMSLLTGLHPEQWDARNELLRSRGEEVLPYSEIRHYRTLPKLLGRVGYASFQGGKYWEGSYQLGGFTRGTKDGRGKALIRVLARGFGRTTLQPLWDFLEEYRDDPPFFVWFAPLLPHRPHDPPRRLVELYKDRDLTDDARLYYANITRFDEGVGNLLEYLDENDLRKDTLVVYLSDNGWEQPPDRETGQYGGDHGKLTIYEYGFRTPLVFSWPGHIPQGRVSEALVSAVDVMPTLLDYAGVEMPPGRLGSSLRGLLSGTGAHAREHVIAGIKTVLRPGGGREPVEERAYFLRDEAWRYVWYVDHDREELYRIEEDPEERSDLAAAEPERRAAYRREIERWREEASRVE